MNSSQIINALYWHFSKKSYPYFSCNTNALNHESDFIAISRANYIVECEIKISRSDFFKDFTKETKHLAMKNKVCIPNYFYFAVPFELVKESEVPDYAGLIYIMGGRSAMIVKPAPLLHKHKISETLLIKILRSIMYKYFNYKLHGKEN